MKLILASASPRRSALLAAAGYTFEVRAVDLDETPRPGESGAALVARLSEAKARAVPCAADEVVLAADTTVVCDDEILNKPEDEADATRMLRRLAGRAHDVYTGVTVRDADGVDTVVARTTVEFVPLSEAQIAWYVASGEPLGKAGAYGIQGLASRFVDRVDGSYTNVVGLPVADVAKLLAKYL